MTESGTPRRVLLRHAADWMNQPHANRRSTWLGARLEPPVVLESSAVPANHGVRLNEDERAPPLFQHPHRREPEDAVAVLDVRPLDAALVHGELVS